MMFSATWQWSQTGFLDHSRQREVGPALHSDYNSQTATRRLT